MNLISNAYKFTSAGGIEVTIKVVNTYTEAGSERRLEITVEDTGIGISSKDQLKLFKMFSMVDQHKNEYNTRGTGLGLTITQKLVHLLGGEVNLISKENEGTKVTFYVREKADMRREVDDRPLNTLKGQKSCINIPLRLGQLEACDKRGRDWESSFDSFSPRNLNRIPVMNTKRSTLKPLKKRE